MKKKISVIFILITVLLVTATLWLSLLKIFSEESINSNLSNLNFNAINSLFSALAFAGVIMTLILQNIELELQRQELVETRKELARTASAQEESKSALDSQVKTMYKTAKINALSSLISANDFLMARCQPTGMEIEDCKNNIKKYTKQLEFSLNDLNTK